ncbi:hypothetical protein BOTBODRAFT_185039 [Botryobasidium botryosum FD-172 SS1]|uniref:Major facilitator superfamily (MFS) profile domain-containing protein n=1 Tax=Botryobasidium botryosum (strain FD-172 SS1) TaxID=930990 RepID=A0A067MUN8_BOTB1|nr:hypothetical protein BOTBODRAFT_185039 [Botryobasidium botryosum FD-172 SS1]
MSPAATPEPESRSDTPVDIEKSPIADEKPAIPPRTPLTGFRKFMVMTLLCCAQFFDIVNASGAIIALPVLGKDLNFSPGATQWVVSAYTLTFASFLVSAGRLTDIYNPKLVFCIGFLTVGVFSVLSAVSVAPVMLLVFRAIQGLGAAMTLPSAIAMIVVAFPEPGEQGRALAIFGAFGALGNVVGVVLGGVLTARASWRWVFYLIAIVVIPFSVLSFLFLPEQTVNEENKGRTLDWPGIGALTGGLILFVYAISDANTVGWKKPQIIVTLVLSVLFFAAFFVIERIVKDPAVPPRTWTNKNFLPLFIYTWSVYWFVFGLQLQIVNVFQELFHWSPLSAALHCLPLGVAGGITAYLTGLVAPRVPRKILLVNGQVFMAVGAVLFALADRPEKYWSYMFPGMILAMIGLASAYVGVSIAIMADARKGEEGIVGAMLNTALQIGATIGLAVVTAVTLGVNKNQPLDAISQHKGYAASFWSLIGVNGITILIALVFVK